MIYGAVLAAIAAAAVVNGFDTVGLSPWRQALFLVLAVLAYLHGRRLAGRYGAQILLAAGALTVPVMGVDRGNGLTAFLVLAVFVMLPWFGGRYRRQQVELYRAAEERASRLERERELVAERVQAQERARIAADLHDSVGHDLALIALRAGALELAPGLPEASRGAAAALRANAVEATDRLRQALGLLRDEAAPVTPFDEPVRDLVARSAAAGLDVRLEAEAAGAGTVVDRAVYRIVQEALTNAAKHAPGSAVAVRVERSGEAVRVAVANTAAPAAALAGAGHRWPHREAPGAAGGLGSGLAGLAERVRLLGGSFSAGPREGGFAVEAELPVRGDR
ncbi:sensor histidine kinase [Glycomyces terrestris]|uniref:histidine kinase n=1 Tax=Glycomyces terrestris TaxID=2493553 RepID=A0A426UV75_9ACTN|nr:sensor histidine kinase [Glycomyces terrestris]RRR98220.1 two-component sensor histidine kinase [Glycomyces terrestris]